jgi:hypothetical protein
VRLSYLSRQQSAILLENNGRSSSSQCTRHINIRYYFITDKVKPKEVCLEHCLTENMIADFFTKPLQGAKFTTFQSFILCFPQCHCAIIPHFLSILVMVAFLLNTATTGVCWMDKEKRDRTGYLSLTINVSTFHQKRRKIPMSPIMQSR